MISPVTTFLLLLFCSSTCVVAHAGADELHYTFMGTSSLKPNAVCNGLRVHTSPNNHTGSWMLLSRPHGPCSSSSLEEGADSAPSLVDTLRWDQYRADHIYRKLSGNISQEDLGVSQSNTEQITGSGGAITPGVGGGNPVTSDAKIDGPAATGGRLPGGVKQTMLLDTASDVAWVQCAPCPASQCYAQTDVLYDPTRSGSSAPFPCSSPTCRQLGPYANGCTSNNQCQYRVQYPDGSTTSGTFISDVLTLNPATQLAGFQFGCSHAARGRFSRKIAGIMALGRGAQSLASQTKAGFGDVFSYCFPPTASHQGFFTLGVPRRSRTRYAVTPMLQSAQAPMLYLVRLQAITVAGQRLSVLPTVFAAGAVLDSRTTITRLPPTAYQALRSVFRANMRMYRLAAPSGQLDTCYDFSGVRRIKLPKISLVFDRAANVELDPSGILFNNCLAFTSSGDDRSAGIIGYVQLQTIEVLYNVPGSSVGFRLGAC